jgi:hypothetical protein
MFEVEVMRKSRPFQNFFKITKVGAVLLHLIKHTPYDPNDRNEASR